MAEEVYKMDGRLEIGGQGRVGHEVDEISENPPESIVGSSSYPTDAGSLDYKGGRHVEEQDRSGSGVIEALSETFIPMGQPSRRFDSYHHHQFVPHEPTFVHKIIERKDMEFRHCDIIGHEHNQCRACHQVDDHALHHEDESNHDNKLHSLRTPSAKKTLRITPARIVEGRLTASSSTKGKRLLLSTASSGATDRLQQTTRATTGQARTSLNLGRRTLPRQKVKRVEPSSSYSYEPSIVEEPSYLSPRNSYRQGNLRTTYKFEPPTVKLRGANDISSNKLRGFISDLALGSTYSSQLPHTSLSSIARAQSKETLDELRSYRRSSKLPYAAECSICQTKDNQHVFQTRDASTDEQAAKDDYLMRQVPPFQGYVGEILDIPSFTKFHFPTTRPERKISVSQLSKAKMQAAAIGKKKESDLVESQLRRELLVAHEKLCDVKHIDQQEVDATIDSLSQEIYDNSQVGQNFGALQTECEYLRKELIHMKKHFDLLSGHYELFLEGLLSNSEQPIDFSRLESAQKLVTDLRCTLEESQERLLQFEECHEKHEGDLHMKLIEMQEREAKLVKELRHPQDALDPHDGQKELTRITNQLHVTTEQLESLQLEYDSLNRAQEECKVLKKQVELLNSELEKQKELTEKWKEDSESKEQNLISKNHEAMKMEMELRQSQEFIFSNQHATSELTRDLKIHRESLNSKDLILATLEKEYKQSQESLEAKELRVLELEEKLQQAQETLEFKEQHTSKLEQEIQQHEEHLSSKELTFIKLDEDLKQHRQSLLVKDQTIAEMERTLQVHRESITQTEENAKNLQKELGKTKTRLHEALDNYNVREKQMNEVVEKDRIRLNEVMRELDITKGKLNDVLAELGTKTLEETHFKRKSIQDLEDAQEQCNAQLDKNNAMQAQLDFKLQEESSLRRKSMMDLQESQEQLRGLQIKLNAKTEEEEKVRLKSLQDLKEIKENFHAVKAQLDSKSKEERNLRIKSSQDLQELQEQVSSWKELQSQTDEKHKEANKLWKESVQELQKSQEQLLALQTKLDEKAEEERNFKMISAQELHKAQEQLKARKEMLAHTQEILEEEKSLRRNTEHEFHRVHEQLQAEMKRELEKEQVLHRNSMMDLQLTQGQLKEMKELKAHVDEEEQSLKRKVEQDLVEAKQQLHSEREHMMQKEEEEKHLRRKSMQDLHEIKEKMRIMQHDHGRQSIISTEKLSVLLAQQQDLIEQLETVHIEKKQLESNHEQALFELEMIRKVFAGLKDTLAKHDLCVDFVEDVEKVLKDLHTMIDHHKTKQHTRRKEYSDLANQELKNNEFFPRRSSASKVLRDMQSMMDNQRQRRGKDEDYTEYSNQGFSNKMSKKSHSVMSDTSLGTKMKTFSRHGTSSRVDFSDGIAKTSVFGGGESHGEELPLEDAEDLKEELEDRLDDVLTTFGVRPDSEGITDETYEKLVHERFPRKPSSDGVDLLDKLDIFEAS